MNRARIASLALRAYPREARTVSDAEMLGTLLDAAEDCGSDATFLRELASVTRGGLAARTRLALGQPNWRLGVEALSWFAVVCCIWISVLDIENPLPSVDGLRLWLVLVPAVPIITALGFRRAAGLVGIAIVVEHVLAIDLSSWKDLGAFAALTVGFGAMIAAPALRRRSLRGRAWHLLALSAAVLVCALWPGAHILGYVVPTASVAVVALPFVPALSLGIGGIFFLGGLAESALRPSDVWLGMVMLCVLPVAVLTVKLLRLAVTR